MANFNTIDPTILAENIITFYDSLHASEIESDKHAEADIRHVINILVSELERRDHHLFLYEHEYASVKEEE